MTTFNDGLYQYGGSPVSSSLFVNKLFTNNAATKGRAWFVDPTHGNNQGGRRPDRAFTTMDTAFDNVKSGDIIYFVGNIAEQLSTPVQVFDVTIVGCGNQPRHADATPAGGSYAASTWKTPSSPTSTTPLLTIRQQGWRLVNILFDGPSDAAAVQIFRDGGSGDDERDGSHAHIVGCKFVAGQNHIEFKGGPSQVVIEDNLFFGATADSIMDTVGAGIGTDNYFRILNNHFHNNDGHIDAPLNYATIRGNVFGAAATAGVDLTGGSNNVISGNYFHGDFNVLNTAGTTDMWAGNFAEETGGVTDADPTGS